jgi:hypothetical protein
MTQRDRFFHGMHGKVGGFGDGQVDDAFQVIFRVAKHEVIEWTVH